MNQGDCFILDNGKEIFVYVGPQAKGTERLKAINVANQVRDQDHSGRAKVNIVGKQYSKIILYYIYYIKMKLLLNIEFIYI